MKLSAIALLEDAEARRLVAVWGAVGADALDLHDEELLTRWSEVAGVSLWSTRRIVPGLLAVGVIAPRGVVDQVAEQVIGRLARRELGIASPAPPAPKPRAPRPKAPAPRPSRRRREK